ncbi:MAG: HesA/MoeB/ThiF family protein [Methanothrix sp.]|nr:HesA/MoeB/ThiF family protein [Methanothrix sp.]
MLTEEERLRYSRQISLFGEDGQEKLKRTTAFVAGAGGLGSIVSLYLAAAGLGRIRIVDCDRVEVSNLNRQVLHSSRDTGRSKAASAFEALKEINPEIEVEALEEKIDEESLESLLEGCDLIVDALDNFATRYLLNDAAIRGCQPLFHGAISGFQGQVTTVIPGRTACLRCIFPRPPPQLPPPALGSTCGIIGSIQATEAVKYVLGSGRLLENRLLIWDGLSACLDEVVCERDPSCPGCGRVS